MMWQWPVIELGMQEFFLLMLLGGLLAVVAVMIPVQIASKMRRVRRRRTHAICRVCGYRFLRRAERGIVSCPHCGVNNK